MRRTSFILAALAALLLQTACGQKGPLKLPPENAPPKAAAASAVTPAAPGTAK